MPRHSTHMQVGRASGHETKFRSDCGVIIIRHIGQVYNLATLTLIELVSSRA